MNLCPDGVTYRRFGDVASVVRGASPRPIQNFITDDPDAVPWIKIGDVSAASKYITRTAQRITADGAAKSRRIYPGDFVLSNSMSFGRPYISKIEGCIHDGWLAISSFSDSFIPDFLYHLLRSAPLQAEFARRAGAGAVQNLNADIVKAVDLPVPPLEIQREIARFLDRFTDLEAEVDAEREARRKQYSHYLDQLLTLPEGDVQWTTLGEVGEFTRGRRFTKSDYVESGLGCIHYGQIYTDYGTAATTTITFLDPERKPSMRLAHTGDLVIAATGENVEEVCKAVAWLGADDIAVHDDCQIFRHKLNPKYVSYFFQTASFNEQKGKYVSESKVVRVSGANLANIRLQVPPIEEQARIVALLENFDMLISDSSVGLPAEITARRKQYEYYRDKLMTFEEATA
jgi:type I restriction enzyme, S subunit